MPEWYGLVTAAHYLHVPPWELADQPSVWMEWALMADDIDKQMAAQRVASMFGGGKGKK